MKIIRPIEITDAILTGSSVVEDDYDEFVMGTTYSEGDTVMVTSGNEILTLDVAPATDWDPGDIITGQTSTETCVAVLKITALTYYVRERSGAFTLGEIIGVTGTPAKLADQGLAHPTFTAPTDNIHKVYESVSGSNTGNFPTLDVLDTVPNWLDLGYNNRWKTFDEIIESQTTAEVDITYQFTPGQSVNSIAFMNMENISKVRIVSTDPVDGVVYDFTKDLVATEPSGLSGVVDWYSYFFSSVILISDFWVTDLPPYLNTVIDITLTYGGDTSSIGEIVLGLSADFGNTLYSPSIGIHDYSIKEQNSFGQWVIAERSFSKKMTCDVTVENASIPHVVRLLAYYRAKPLVYIGSDEYESLAVYGYVKDWNTVISYPEYAILTIEVAGLI